MIPSLLNLCACGLRDQAPAHLHTGRPGAAALQQVFKPRLTVSVDNAIYTNDLYEEDTIMSINSCNKTQYFNCFTLYHCMNYERKKYDEKKE